MKLWYIYLLYLIVDEPQQRMVVSARSEDNPEGAKARYGDQFNLEQFDMSQDQEYKTRPREWHEGRTVSSGMNSYFYLLKD